MQGSGAGLPSAAQSTPLLKRSHSFLACAPACGASASPFPAAHTGLGNYAGMWGLGGLAELCLSGHRGYEGAPLSRALTRSASSAISQSWRRAGSAAFWSTTREEPERFLSFLSNPGTSWSVAYNVRVCGGKEGRGLPGSVCDTTSLGLVQPMGAGNWAWTHLSKRLGAGGPVGCSEARFCTPSLPQQNSLDVGLTG